MRQHLKKRSIYRRITSVILTMVLVLSLVAGNKTVCFATGNDFTADIDEKYQEDIGIIMEEAYDDSVNEIPDEDDLSEEEKGVAGLIDVDYRADYDENESDVSLLRATYVPAQYDSRSVNGSNYVTSVKNQGSYNTCWAFSALGAAESDMMKKGLVSGFPDYSEYQLAYFLYHRQTDALGNTYGDANNIVNGSSYLTLGSTAYMPTFALASWTGAANETVALYGSASATSSLSSELAYLDTAHLENAYFIPMKSSEDVKKMIMEHGSVSSSIYTSTSNIKWTSSGEYCLYQKTKTSCDHAILVIGWDDNYSKDNFSTSPENNGAWLVKNSWGSSYQYIWVSYEDTAISNADAIVYDFNISDNYDYNYQYDGTSCQKAREYINGTTLANVFTVSGSKREKLEAVSFAFAEPNVNYSIQIYKNSPEGNPTGGQVLLSTPIEGVTTYEGYYTVPLDRDIVLSKGDTFTVAVTGYDFNADSDGYVGFFVDQNATLTARNLNGNTETCVQFVNNAKEKQNYYINGATIIDLYTYSGYAGLNVCPRIKAFTTKDDSATIPDVTVSYKTHVQTYSWQDWVTNGTTSGTVGQAKRLEGIRITVSGNSNLGISYKTHVQTYGWQNYVSDGVVSGTEGEAKRLEAISIKLTGSDADQYDVYYRVHAQTYGWLGWAKNGQYAGTSGQAKRLEGIQIMVLPKGEKPSSGSIGYSYIELGKSAKNSSDAGMVNYMTHVQTYGNQSYVYDGSVSGTSGEAKRLEGIRISVNNALTGVSGGITYRTHVQTYGWLDWTSNGIFNGTSGEGKRLEAIEIKLTGDMANQYDVYYRVHSQTYGWLGWTKNGQRAGTEGLSKRLEGIQIVLLPKGSSAPGYLPGQSGMPAYIKK